MFYRPEHNAKEESHGTEFVRSGNAKMTFITKYSSKSQRIEKKNWVICRLMMLTPGFIVIRMSKKVLVWEKYWIAFKRSYLALWESAIKCWVLS